MELCNFHSVLFFTHEEIQINPGVEWVNINQINDIQAYNRFILKDLAAHISTDFALLIQWDGYILDTQYWRSDFMDYDYIGARWHWQPSMANTANGRTFFLNNARTRANPRRFMKRCAQVRCTQTPVTRRQTSPSSTSTRSYLANSTGARNCTVTVTTMI